MVVEAHMKKLREIQVHKANALALMDFVRRLEDVRRLLTSIGCKYSSHLDNQDVTITLMRKLPDKGLRRKWVDRVPLKCPQCSGPHGVWKFLFKRPFKDCETTQRGVTLYFSMKFPSITPKKTRNGHFWDKQISAHSK